MWSSIKRLFSSQPNAAEILLNHFDRLAGSEPRFVQISDDGVRPALHALIYRGFPTPDAITGFTGGLSHFHPPGGGHKELMISMRDTDDRWALACADVAFQHREQFPFGCGSLINFSEPITRGSKMSAFLVVHPRHISPQDSIIDLGVREVELMELIPIYEEERVWLSGGGDKKTFLENCPTSVSMDPKRKSLAPN